MKTFAYATAFVALISNVLASPVATASMFMPITFEPLTTLSPTSSSTTASPTCTKNIFIQPPKDGGTCLDYAVTSTIVENIDCGGCALVTQHLGFGLPCQKTITLESTKMVTETACGIPTNAQVPPFQPASTVTTTTATA